MIAEQIRELQRAAPFEPYTIYTSDVVGLYLKHSDCMVLTPGNQTADVYSTEVKRVANITRVFPGPAKRRSRR